MRPVLFTIGPFVISSYATMICLGALGSLWLTLREVDRLGLDRPTYIKICMIMFASGIVGARLMNCIVFYDIYRDAPWWKMLAFWEGGLAMYGGFLLALVLSWIYIRYKRLSYWQVLDTLIPCWILLLVFGRLGCFLNGCCYGKPTLCPLGVHMKGMELALPTHPTQIYEASAAFLIFLVLWGFRRRAVFRGQIFLVTLILYSAARFVIEFFRADPRGMWRFFGGITLSESQIVSIWAFLFCLVAWAILSRRPQYPETGHKTHEEKGGASITTRSA